MGMETHERKDATRRLPAILIVLLLSNVTGFDGSDCGSVTSVIEATELREV